MTIGPGQVLGHFRLLEKLGQGGMGVVWKAEDTELGRAVAIKLLPASMARDERFRRMFLDEARLASSLSDAHIAQVHELGRDGDLDFIVMEFVEGSALSRLLQGRPMAPATVADIGAQVAETLARTHHRGLLHRDLKPANIIVGPDGTAKIVDFGLAKLFQRRGASSDPEEPTLTGVSAGGAVLGTPSHMSPEQVRGEDLDGRSDVFSLGVVLYQMTTGQLPFRSETTEGMLAQILRSQPKPARDLVPQLPFDLDRIILKAMAARRADRYQTMEDLAVDLRRLGQEIELGSAPSYAELRQAPPDAPSLRAWPGRSLVGGLALLVLVVTGLWMWLTRRATPAPQNLSVVLILPLDVRGQSEGAEYAGRAFAEALAVNLARMKELSVLPVPASGLSRQADALAPAKAGREVGAGSVLIGALTREAGSVHASLSLVDATRSRVVWGEQQDGADGDLPILAAALARRVAGVLGAVPPRLYDYFKNTPRSASLAESPDLSAALGAIRRYEVSDALESTSRLVRSFPNDPDACVLRSYALLLDAAELDASSPKRDALEESLAALVRADRNSPWDEVFHASLLSRDGRYQEATQIFSKVLARDDLTPSARAYVLNGRAGSQVGSSDGAKALEDLREALTLDPANDVTLRTLSSVLLKMRRPEEALARARQAVALNPTSGPSNLKLGEVMFHLQRWDESASALAKACQADRSQTSCAFSAVALQMAGREGEAREQADRAASLPESDTGAYNLACYNALIGRRAEALRLLQRSLDLGPADLEEITSDTTLVSLRSTPEFKRILSEAARHARK